MGMVGMMVLWLEVMACFAFTLGAWFTLEDGGCIDTNVAYVVISFPFLFTA
jgi:hypothetical protein